MSDQLSYLLKTTPRDQAIRILRGIGYTIPEIREMLPSEPKYKTTWFPPHSRSTKGVGYEIETVRVEDIRSGYLMRS